MKRIMTTELVPGMVISENVLTLDRQLIIAKGTVVTEKIILKLDMNSIYMVFIDDTPKENKSPDITPVPEEAPKSYSQRIKASKSFQEFKAEYELNVDSFKNEINNVVEKNINLDVKTLISNSLKIVANNKGQIGIMDMLQNMRNYDDSTYAHCMNVALICNIFAGWLKMDANDIELATACGLLHDIGKLLVPQEIITKPGKLSDAEFLEIQKHPVAGYNLLKDQKIDQHIKYAALMHHERMDGNGYPMRLKGPQIDKFAKIVAIADVYDAMTAARVYRGPLCPFKVIEMFEEDSYQKYDVAYLCIFLENVVNSYINNSCRLSDGREGIIIFINKDKPSKPIVKVGDEYVNLAEKPGLIIDEIL